jgi:hypothetical protein
MKEDTRHRVRAYASRGSSVVTLLALAFCPFALAQRNAGKDVTKRASSSVSEMNQSLLPYDVTVTNRGQRPSSVRQKPDAPSGIWLGVPETSGRPTASRPNQAFRCMATRGSGGCATPTPTAPPACTPAVITGSIDNSDPTQVDRLFRSFTPGNCYHTFTCSTRAAGAIHYDAYTFTNTTGSTQCVTVDMNTACGETNFIFTAAHLSSFDPNNICANWIADEGESPNPQNQFSFKIDADQTYILVVSEVNAGAGCPGYTMTVTCEPYQPPPPICPPTITQSTSHAIVDFNAVACADPGLGTLENHYWRAFDMNTLTGGQAYNITSVEFGIEQALSLFGTDQPLTVNLYTNHGAPFPDGDWRSNLLATSGSINIPNQEGTIFNVSITATVPAGTSELVMEVLSPDQTAKHNNFIIGSNQAPETGPSYSSAPDCGNPDPVPWSEIGFPNIRQVFNINGCCEGPAPTPTPTPTATPTLTPTPSATPTPTPTVTTTPTPGATPAPRPTPSPRPRPTPLPRPTPPRA